MRPSYLPAAAGLSVVGEVVTDPLVDLAERHAFPWRPVDGEGDEAGVAVGRLPVPVLRRLLLLQRGAALQVQRPLLAGAVAQRALAGVQVVVGGASVVQLVPPLGLLDGGSHAELGEPVHGGQAALQLRRHGGEGAGPGSQWAGSQWVGAAGAESLMQLSGQRLNSSCGSDLEETEL